MLENIEAVEVSGSELKVNHDNGTEETLVLKEENRLIRMMESSADPLRVRIDFESVTDAWLLIRTEGSFLFELKENVGFKENPSTVFMDIGGILRITSVKPGIGAGHAAGYFRMHGNPCFVLEENVNTVYWRGSLSCAMPIRREGRCTWNMTATGKRLRKALFAMCFALGGCSLSRSENRHSTRYFEGNRAQAAFPEILEQHCRCTGTVHTAFFQTSPETSDVAKHFSRARLELSFGKPVAT